MHSAWYQDACWVRAVPAPHVLAARRTTVGGVLQQAHRPHLAAAGRPYAGSPASGVLTRLGLSPSEIVNEPAQEGG